MHVPNEKLSFHVLCCYYYSVAKLCPTLCVALQAPLLRLEHWNGLPLPSPGDLSDPGIKTTSPAWQVECLSLNQLGSPLYTCCAVLCCAVLCLVAQSCLTLCDPMDCCPPGSSARENFLGKNILQWVAMFSSRGSSQFRDQMQVSHIVGRFFSI